MPEDEKNMAVALTDISALGCHLRCVDRMTATLPSAMRNTIIDLNSVSANLNLSNRQATNPQQSTHVLMYDHLIHY